jgi:hypothetical protein
MSNCLVLQGKNFIAIGADTASSIMFNGCYKRIGINAKKLYHFGNEIMFCSGRMDLVESVTSNIFLTNNKIDLNKLTKFINSMNIKKSHTYDLEILICGVENNKSYIHQISQYSNFKVKTITNETNGCAVYSTGFNSKLMLSTAKKNYSIHKNITDLFIKSFKEISSEEVGGYMNMYLIQENQITKCIDEYKVDDIEPIKIETKDVHFVVADVLIGDLIAGETLMISNGSKTFIVDKDGIIVNNMKLDMYSADKKHRLLIDPNLKSMFNIYNEDKQVFFIDANGNVTMKGNLYINNGSTYLKADMDDENIIEIGTLPDPFGYSVEQTDIKTYLSDNQLKTVSLRGYKDSVYYAVYHNEKNELYYWDGSSKSWAKEVDNPIVDFYYKDNYYSLCLAGDGIYHLHLYCYSSDLKTLEKTLVLEENSYYSDADSQIPNYILYNNYMYIGFPPEYSINLDTFEYTHSNIDLNWDNFTETNPDYYMMSTPFRVNTGYDDKLYFAGTMDDYTLGSFRALIEYDLSNLTSKYILNIYDYIPTDNPASCCCSIQIKNQVHIFCFYAGYPIPVDGPAVHLVYDISTGNIKKANNAQGIEINHAVDTAIRLDDNTVLLSSGEYCYKLTNNSSSSSDTSKLFYVTNDGQLYIKGDIYARSLTLGSDVSIDTSKITGLDDKLKDIKNDFNGVTDDLKNVVYKGDIVTTTEKLDNGVIKTTSRVPTGVDADGNVTYEDSVTYTSADGNYVMTDVGLGDKEKENGCYTIISKEGLLEAVNAKVSGTVYANAGKFGGWDIGKNGLKSELFDDASNTNGIRLDSNGEIRSKGSMYSSIDGDGSEGWFARLRSGKWIFGYYDSKQSDPFIPPADTPYSDISVNGIYMCSKEAIQNKDTRYLFEANTLNDTVNITNSSKTSPALTITNNYYDSVGGYDAPALVLHSPKQGYRNRPFDVRLKVTGKLLGTDQTVNAQYSVALFGEEQLGRIIFRSNTFDATSSPVGNTVSDTSSNPTVPSILGSDTFRWYQGYFMELYSKNGVNTSSDKKIKNHIGYMNTDKSLEFVNDLKPVEYTLKDNANGRKHMGFYAQDVKETADNLELGNMSLYSAVWNKDGNEKYYSAEAPDKELNWSLKYEEFIAPLVGAAQELTKRDKENKERISKLEDTVKDLVNELKSLKEQLNK